MRPFKGFFLVWLIVELVVFYLVAEWLGFLVAILLIILPMIIGGGIMQSQGFANMRRLQEKMQTGESPAVEVLESVAIVFGGMLMLIPGMVTSVIGIVLLIPGIRRGLLSWLLRKHLVKPGAKHGDQQKAQGKIYDADSWHDDS